MSKDVTYKEDKAFQYAFFNKFQDAFYTSIPRFNMYSDYEINLYAFALVNVIGKGFPHKAFDILGIYGNVIKFNECPEIIKALQHDFVGGFVRNNKKHVYFKQSKVKAKAMKNKAKILTKKRTPKGVIDFNDDVRKEIMERLFMDSKDYQELKFTPQVQNLGNEITRNK